MISAIRGMIAPGILTLSLLLCTRWYDMIWRVDDWSYASNIFLWKYSIDIFSSVETTIFLEHIFDAAARSARVERVKSVVLFIFLEERVLTRFAIILRLTRNALSPDTLFHIPHPIPQIISTISPLPSPRFIIKASPSTAIPRGGR